MKFTKKELAHSFATSIESKLGEQVEVAKNFKNPIEKSTKKLAKKLVKLLKKADKNHKPVVKASKKSKKSAGKKGNIPASSEKLITA